MRKKKIKPSFHVINRRHAYFLSTGDPLCARHQRRTATVYIKPLPHPSRISGGRAKPLLRPGCLTRSQQPPWFRWSHRSQKRAHSDAAGCSVINKKWRHEVLAGWTSHSEVQHQSHRLVVSCLFSSWFLFTCLTCLQEWKVSMTQAAACREHHSRWLKDV